MLAGAVLLVLLACLLRFEFGESGADAAVAFNYPPQGEPPAWLDVVESGARFEVSLEGTGWLRLDLTAQGAAYGGIAQMTLLRGRSERQRDGSFRAIGAIGRGIGPPYLVEGLAPGTYTLMLLTPTFRSATGESRMVVEVHPGEESVVHAVLAL